MEDILGKINVCKNLLQKYKVRFALSPFMTIFMTFVFYFFFWEAEEGGGDFRTF